jgi:S-adenosylmethionine synthetase
MAWDIAQEIWKKTKIPCEVFIISQSDKPINTPWSVIVNSSKALDPTLTREIATKVITNVSKVTDQILRGQYDLA